MYKSFTIPENGVRVYLWNWDCTSVGISVTIESGSRNDPLSQVAMKLMRREVLMGLNHGYEHITARATRKHPSWQDLAEATDASCSDFNAETDKTTIAVYVETDRQHAVPSINLMGEIIIDPFITAENVRYELERADQERRQYADQPEERAALDLDRMMFGEDGLAHPILGTVESLKMITVEDIRRFKRQVVRGRRLIVCVAGNFDPLKIEAVIRRVFGRIPAGQPAPEPGLDYRRLRGGIALRTEESEQIYCHVGVPLFGVNDPRRLAMSIIRNHLSGRASSKVKVGASSLAFGYSALDYLMHWRDIGQYHISIPVSPDRFLKTLQIVAETIGRIRGELLSRHDFDLAVTNLSIGARARFGDPLRAAIFMGEFTASAGQFVPLREYLRALRSVNRQQVRRVARDIFTHSRLCIAARGPLRGITKDMVRRAMRW